MLRLLRKYNKFILVIFGSLLMIVFLIPDAIQRLGSYSAQRGAAWATLTLPNGREIRATAMDQSNAQYAVRLLRETMNTERGNPLDLLGVRDPAHWYLLALEAREAGLMGGPNEAYSMLGETRESAREMIFQLARAAQIMDPNRVVEIFNELIAIQRLVSLYSNAGKLSDLRLKQFANEEMLGVTGEYIVLRAGFEGESLADFTAEQLQAQFDAYRTDAPGEGTFGFGYLLPDRVKLEWLTISEAGVRASLEQRGQPDDLEIRKHWLQNRASFASFPGGGDRDAETAFAAVRGRVREALLRRMTNDLLEEIQRFAEGELNKLVRSLPRDGQYRTLPADWDQQRLRFTILAEDIQQRFNIELPAYAARNDRWLTQDDLRMLPGIGFSRTDRFGGTRLFGEVVFAARELGAQQAVFIQKGIAGPPMRGNDGSIHFFRILDVSPAHAPVTIDEVAESVAYDLRRVELHRRLVARLDEIRLRSMTEGFDAIAQEFAAAPPQPATNISRTDIFMLSYGIRQASALPGLTTSDATVDNIINHAATLMERSVAEQIAIADFPLADRIIALEVPDELAVILFRITAVTPMLIEDFGQIVQLLAFAIGGDEADTSEAYSFDALKQRFKFEFLRAATDDEHEI